MEDAPAAHAVHPKTWLTSQDGVPNTVGTKTAVTASSHTKVEEIPMPCFTTPTVLSMSDSGKSTKATGHHAAEDTPHATCNKT